MRPGKDYMASEDDLTSIMRQRHFLPKRLDRAICCVIFEHKFKIQRENTV